MSNLKTNITIKLNDLFSKPMAKIGNNFKKLSRSKGFNKLGKSAKKSKKDVDKLNKSLHKSKDLMGMLGDIASVWAGAKIAQKPFSSVLNREEVEFGLGTLTKNLEQFKKLSKEIGNSGLYGYTETMEEFYALLSGGFSENMAQKSAKQIQVFARATRSSLNTATETIVGAVNVSGVDIQKATDVFTAVQYKYQLTNLEQLARGYKNVGAVAKTAAKLGFLETNVLLGTLNSNMVEGERAGTALSAVLRNLPRLQKAGVKIKRDDNGNLDIVETLKNIKAVKDSIQSVEGQNKFLQDMFGEEGVKGILPLINNIEQIRKDIIEINKANGLAQRKGAKWQGTLTANLTKLSTAFGNLGQSLGLSMLPVLTRFIEVLSTISNIVADLIIKFPILGKIAYAMIGTFLLLKTWKIAKIFFGVARGANALKYSLKGVMRAMGVGFLLEGLGFVLEHWEQILDIIKKVWGYIKKITVSFSNTKIVKWVNKLNIVRILPTDKNNTKPNEITNNNKANITVNNYGNRNVEADVKRAQEKSFKNMKFAGIYNR